MVEIEILNFGLRLAGKTEKERGGMKKLDETLNIQETSMHRRENCKYYDQCLNEASSKRWRSFSCLDCTSFEESDRVMPEIRRASTLAW